MREDIVANILSMLIFFVEDPYPELYPFTVLGHQNSRCAVALNILLEAIVSVKILQLQRRKLQKLLYVSH